MTIIKFLIILELISMPAGILYYDSGTVAYYQDPGLMQEVLENRKSWGQDLGDLDKFVDGIAMNDCGLLGETVFIRVRNGPLIGPLLVVDCACAEHLPGRIGRGLIADLGYHTAVELLEADTYIEDVIIYLERNINARLQE